MFNPYYFTDRELQAGFNVSLISHHINHANSKIIVRPNYPEIGIEVRYINKFRRELSVIYARIINEYKFNFQAVFSARFHKQVENIQVLDETEVCINLNVNHILTETYIDNIDIGSQLEHQIQIQETKKTGWRLDEINSMTIYFYKTGEMNSRSYTKILLRSAGTLNVKNDDKFCLFG